MSALGLPGELEPDEVESRLQALGELAHAREQMVELERRIAGMRRDESDFEQKVRALVESHAPDLAELAVDRAADELHQRFDRARRDREQLEALLPEIAEREREQSFHAAQCEAAERDLAELRQAVGARDLAELIAVEGKAQRAQELSRELCWCSTARWPRSRVRAASMRCSARRRLPIAPSSPLVSTSCRA